MSDDADALMRRLRSRRSAPGMLDLGALRGSSGAAGLGLAAAPLVRRLNSRRSGAAMPAVAAGELVLAQPPGAASISHPEARSPEMPAAPALARAPAVPVTRVPGAAEATADSVAAPISPTDETIPRGLGVPPRLPLARAAASAGGAVVEDTAAVSAETEAMPAAASVAPTVPPPVVRETLVAAPELAPPALDQPALPVPRSSSVARSEGGVAVPLPDLSRFVPDAAYGEPMPAVAAMPSGRRTVPYAPPTAIGQAAAFPVPAQPADDAPFEELSDRIARDLRRRLAVERERQGRPRWKS